MRKTNINVKSDVHLVCTYRRLKLLVEGIEQITTYGNQIIILEILKILLRLQLLFPFLQAIRYRLWVVHKFDVDV